MHPTSPLRPSARPGPDPTHAPALPATGPASTTRDGRSVQPLPPAGAGTGFTASSSLREAAASPTSSSSSSSSSSSLTGTASGIGSKRKRDDSPPQPQSAPGPADDSKSSASPAAGASASGPGDRIRVFVDGQTPWTETGIALRERCQGLIARSLDTHPPAEVEAVGYELARRIGRADAGRLGQVQLHRAVALALSDGFATAEESDRHYLGQGPVALLCGVLRGGLPEGAVDGQAESLLGLFLEDADLPQDPHSLDVSQDDLDKLVFDAPARSALVAVGSTLPLARALQAVLRWDRAEGGYMPGHHEQVLGALRTCAQLGGRDLQESVDEALAALDDAEQGADADDDDASQGDDNPTRLIIVVRSTGDRSASSEPS